jgi:hypothetical protein
MSDKQVFVTIVGGRLFALVGGVLLLSPLDFCNTTLATTVSE